MLAPFLIASDATKVRGSIPTPLTEENRFCKSFVKWPINWPLPVSRSAKEIFILSGKQLLARLKIEIEDLTLCKTEEVDILVSITNLLFVIVLFGVNNKFLIIKPLPQKKINDPNNCRN